MRAAIGARRQDQSPRTCTPCSRLLPRRTCAPTPSAHCPAMRAFRHLSRYLSLVFGFMCAGQCTARLPAAAWRRRQHVWLAWRYLVASRLPHQHRGRYSLNITTVSAPGTRYVRTSFCHASIRSMVVFGHMLAKRAILLVILHWHSDAAILMARSRDHKHSHKR